MTFLVGALLLLLKSSGMMAQLPTKSLFWLSRRHVQGNSPGALSPWSAPVTRLGCLVPHVLPELRTFSRQPWVHGTKVLADWGLRHWNMDHLGESIYKEFVN